MRPSFYSALSLGRVLAKRAEEFNGESFFMHAVSLDGTTALEIAVFSIGDDWVEGESLPQRNGRRFYRLSEFSQVWLVKA